MLEHEYTVLGGVSRVRIGHYLGILSGGVSAAVVFVGLWAVDLAKTFGISANLPPSILSLVGAGTVFVVLYWILDRFAWRWRVVSKLLKVPNLSGEWECTGKTINAQGESIFDWTAKVTIIQTWDRIRVRLKTDTSASNSTSAALIHDEADGFRLFYSYSNEPKMGQHELHAHRGSAEITFAKDVQSAEGEYFNGYGRYTFGRMSLKRL